MIIFAVLIATGAAAIGGMAFRTWNDVKSPAAKPNPYNTAYQAATYPGTDLIRQITATAPDGVGSWKAADASKADPDAELIPESCSTPGKPSSLLAMRSASGPGVKVTAAVFGAGQAMNQYLNLYEKQLAGCYQVTPTPNSATYANGFILTRGDVIIGGQVSDPSKVQQIQNWYASHLESALQSTGCVSLDETANDALRSFYYDQKAYVGLLKEDTVEVHDTIIDYSSPQQLVNAGMDTGKIFPTPVTGLSTPEGPLPSGMQASLPAAPAVERLTVPPTRPDNKTTISYQVEDVDGPGCGWKWAGQKAPTYNKSSLEQNKASTISKAEETLKDRIKNFNAASVVWSSQAMLVMSGQSQWDDYTNQVNAIYASWNDLTSKRIAFRPTWVTYVDDHNTWLQWKQDRDTAQKQWDADVQSCVATAVKEKEQEDAEKNDPSDTPSDDPSPSTSPSPSDSSSSPSPSTPPSLSDDEMNKIKTTCSTKTAKPTILTDPVQDEPKAPAVPDGVTIPDSWPKINQ
jgi:hypothetical protein